MIKNKRLTTTVAPKKGPNSQVPPIKLNNGKYKRNKSRHTKCLDGKIMKDSDHKGKK